MDTDSLPCAPGVYLLRHRVTCDTYVGKALEIRTRVREHLSRLAKGEHENTGLLHVAQQHGVDFDVTALEVTTPDGRREAELRWIAQLRPTLNHNDATGMGCKPLVPRRSSRRGREPKVTVGAKLAPSLLAGVRELAAADERSISFIIERAVEEYLDRHAPVAADH